VDAAERDRIDRYLYPRLPADVLDATPPPRTGCAALT
jgi:hypothetical protein